MTPAQASGSRFLGVIAPVIFMACGSAGASGDPPPPRPARAAVPAPAPEDSLGVLDRGIWSELDPKVQIRLPAGLTASRVGATVDRKHGLLVLSIDGFPRKVYPLAGRATLDVGSFHLALRPGDAAELRPLLSAGRIAAGTAAHDRDGDGIPDPLDVLIGAKKTVLNAAAYTPEAEGYIPMRYPMGDVPRTMGVCTDVIIRAVRNSGLDLQQALHEDIRAARRAYPMIKKPAGDPNIDQRRVGTLLPYFQRHWERHSAKLDDPADPLRPGDVIFMDTFPDRPGPDHIGIISDILDDHGLPLVINNWTDGMVTSEMDLLTFVPVLERFRLPP